MPAPEGPNAGQQDQQPGDGVIPRAAKGDQIDTANGQNGADNDQKNAEKLQ